MSSIFKLSAQDLLKGLVVAVLSAIFATLLETIKAGGLVLNRESLLFIAGAAITSALGYLSKQLATDENGKLGGRF